MKHLKLKKILRELVAWFACLGPIALILKTLRADEFLNRQRYKHAEILARNLGRAIKKTQTESPDTNLNSSIHSIRGHRLFNVLSNSIADAEYLAIPSIPRDFNVYEQRLNSKLREPFKELQLGGLALQVAIDVLEPRTALDVGSGEGAHARLLSESGTKVTAIDYGRSIYFKRGEHYDVHVGDFMSIDLEEKYDLVWMSHVLEHQPNVNSFLKKARQHLKKEGWAVISVPPWKTEVVGGHLTLWTPGLLMYNLILAGFDCRDARIMRYGYNISVFCQVRTLDLPDLSFDSGDVDKLADFFPKGLAEGFNGEMYDRLWIPPGY